MKFCSIRFRSNRLDSKRNIELPNIDKVAKALERDVNEVCQFIKLKINRQIKINTVDDKLIVTIPNFDTKEKIYFRYLMFEVSTIYSSKLNCVLVVD